MRTTFKALQLCIALAICFADYVLYWPRDVHSRTRWSGQGARRVLRVLGVKINVTGEFPASGVLVCNHMSYLDVLVLCAVAPCFFVSKSEVRGWPVIGWLSTMSGTLYVERSRRHSALDANRRIREKISQGLPVVIFPEGTTTDGTHVLPFKTSIFGAVCDEKSSAAVIPMHAAHLAYTLSPENPPNASVAQDISYWGEMTFLPHLLRMLRLRGVHADLRIAKNTVPVAERKQTARLCENIVLSLRESASEAPSNRQAASA